MSNGGVESLSSTSNALRLGNALNAKKKLQVRKSLEINPNIPSSHQISIPIESSIQDPFLSKLHDYLRKFNEASDLWSKETNIHEKNAIQISDLFVKACNFSMESSLLTKDHHFSIITEVIIPYHNLGVMASSTLATQAWKRGCLDIKENKMMINKIEEILKIYDYINHGKFLKNNIKIDPMRSGTVGLMLGFHHGRLDLLDIWHKKLVQYYINQDFPSKLENESTRTNCFDHDCNEILYLIMIAFPMLFSLNRGGLAEELCDALGFEYAEKV